MDEINQKLKEANTRLEKVLEKLVNLALADENDEAAAQQRKEANEEYHRIWNEIFELEAEQKRQLEELQEDPAYDGSSPTLTKEEELAFHRTHAMKEKADVLAAVYEIREACQSGSILRELPAGVPVSALERFADGVYHLQLPELNQDYWQYQIQIRETGISLLLVHTEILYDYAPGRWERNVPEMVPDQTFPLYTAGAKRLSPEEFAGLHGVNADTVLEWIRGGRLRSVIGYGNSWRIPELSLVLQHEEDSIAEYAWQEELPEIPDELYFLKGCRSVLIYPSWMEDRPWELELSGRPESRRIISLPREAAVQLRLWLMAQPEVECVNNVLGDFLSKTISLTAENAERG